MTMSDPMEGIWIDDYEGIPNGWLEHYTLDGATKVPDSWGKKTVSGANSWARTDGGSETLTLFGDSTIQVTPTFGNSFARLTIGDGSGGSHEVRIFQEFKVAQHELNKPMPIYVYMYQNSGSGISTTNRSLTVDIGAEKYGNELYTANIGSTTAILSNVGVSSITPITDSIFFSITFKADAPSGLGTNFILLDGFGPFRAFASNSELALQRNVPVTTWS